MLPFAVAAHALMAVDWFCQLAPIATQVILRRINEG